MTESGETGGGAAGDLRPQSGQCTVDWLPRLRRDFGHRLVNTSEAELMNRSHVTATWPCYFHRLTVSLRFHDVAVPAVAYTF